MFAYMGHRLKIFFSVKWERERERETERERERDVVIINIEDDYSWTYLNLGFFCFVGAGYTGETKVFLPSVAARYSSLVIPETFYHICNALE